MSFLSLATVAKVGLGAFALLGSEAAAWLGREAITRLGREWETEREERKREREALEWERRIAQEAFIELERDREALRWEKRRAEEELKRRRSEEEKDRKIKELERKLKGRSSLPQYKMSKRQRGLCLIINNKNFRNSDAGYNRKGSEIDERNLKELFKELSFTVHVKNDLTADQMRQVAREFAEKDHSEFDAFIFIIMSHGEDKDVIESVDRRLVRIEDLMREFKADKCPTLKYKPKLFFIQTCRGHDRDRDCDRESTASSADIVDTAFSPDSTLSKSVCPQEADFLLAFSTAPGYVAFRDHQYGSPFVQVLVETIREKHDNCHLIEILTEVTRRVVDEGKGKQVPAPTSTLRGQLWL